MDSSEVILDDGLIFLYEHVPHWYAQLNGPIPPNAEERVILQLDYMVFPDRESVEENIWEHTELMCKSVGWEFDPEQWTLERLVPINTN